MTACQDEPPSSLRYRRGGVSASSRSWLNPATNRVPEGCSAIMVSRTSIPASCSTGEPSVRPWAAAGSLDTVS